jgi:hypothetical protein
VPTASAIPKASLLGRLDSWISDAAPAAKGLLMLAGDLGGTASLPRVIGLTESSGPTSLALGAVADGEYLRRSGTSLVGDAGGETLTEEIVATLNNGDSVVVTHPPVPMTGEGAGNIRFSFLSAKQGDVTTLSAAAAERDPLSVFSEDWVKDGTNDGHFASTPDPRVVQGCTVTGTTWRIIRSIGADPTSPNSVVLNSTSPSSATYEIYPTYLNLYGPCVIDTCIDWGNGGTAPNWGAGGFQYGYTTEAVHSEYGSGVDMDGVSAVQVWAKSEYGNNCRVAVSPDGGVTWYSYGATGWTAIDLADLASEGLTPDGTGETVPMLGSSGETPDWDAFTAMCVAEGAELDLRLAYGVEITGVQAGLSVQLTLLRPSTVIPWPLNISSMGGAAGIAVERTSETTARFTWTDYASPSPYSDFRCQVWT